MKENNKGITLLVLTITVILMLIIASTATYYGISAYDNARLTKFETELRVIQAKVELWEEEGKTDIGTELTGDQKNVLNNIYNTDKIDYYRYLSAQDINDLGIDGIEQDFFVIVQLPEITSTFNLTNLYDLLKYRVISAQGLTYRGTTYYTLYELQENDLLASPYSIVPKDAVASLTNKTTEQVTIYSSVQEAVNAAGNSPSIVTLLKDYTEEKEIKTEVGQSIILDINQYTLEVEKPINNNGTLTINGNGIIVNETDFVIKNNDILNIENGEITGCEGILNTSAGKIHITGGTIKGNFNGIPTESGGTLVTRGIMNFGTLIVNEATIEGLYAIYNNSNATAIVNGGTISGNNYGIYNQSTLTIFKGTITGNIGIYNTKSVTVAEGIIQGNTHGIYNNSVEAVLITGGTISGNNYGIYNHSTGTVTIGSDEKLLDKTFPVVSGSSTKSNSRAVYSLNTSSIINFFNGVLKGTASTPYYISGTLNPRMGYTPITTTTVDSDGYYLTTLELDENAVASLTDTSTGKITNYTTVQGAIDAANTNESTVTLLKDVITEDVTVGVNISNHYSNGTITINAGTITGTITGTTLGIYNYNNLATNIKNGGNVSP